MPEQEIHQLKQLAEGLIAEGRYDILLQAIGVPALQHLNIEAAKTRLSELVITPDYRFLLPAFKKEVEMEPIHKAVYILFLNHPEGIELKRLIDHREELLEIYHRTCNRTNRTVKEGSVDRLVNPLDNSINEKCTRIKSAFSQCMDAYQLCYYAISGHTVRHIGDSSKIWYERKKTITLPRELVRLEV